MPGPLQRFVLFLIASCLCAGAQVSANVQVPDIVKAGETVTFKITLDTAPNFDGGAVLVWVTGPGNFITQSACEVKRDQNGCLYPLKLPPDAAGGTWYVSKLAFSAGTSQRDLSFARLPFQVMPVKGLVFPTSAQVAVSPSQVQLLRTEATRLQIRLQSLKARVEGAREPLSGQALTALSNDVANELKVLRQTEDAFNRLNGEIKTSDTAKIFFADLRASYQDTLLRLQQNRSSYQANPTIIPTGWTQPSSTDTGYPLKAQAVFRAFERNEAAYTLVADTESLTFDLEVSSIPTGADISYHRRGDPYQPFSSLTNSVIKSLPLAIWYIQFKKQGFLEREIEHDPYTEANHVVFAELKKK
jgi:hypothetical protein